MMVEADEISVFHQIAGKYTLYNPLKAPPASDGTKLMCVKHSGYGIQDSYVHLTKEGALHIRQVGLAEEVIFCLGKDVLSELPPEVVAALTKKKPRKKGQPWQRSHF